MPFVDDLDSPGLLLCYIVGGRLYEQPTRRLGVGEKDRRQSDQQTRVRGCRWEGLPEANDRSGQIASYVTRPDRLG
jgi:hypothetical protein